MGREANDPIMVHSSIALLQERFRQLQRVKEMREEKELLRMLTDPPNKLSFNVPATPNSTEPFKFFFQPDNFGLIPPSNTSPPQLSLSLWHSPQSNGASCFRSTESSPIYVTSRFSGNIQPLRRANNMSDKSEDFDDVDTSLHL